MKPEELDAIEARAKAATEGPWSKCGIEWEGHTSDSDPELSVVCHGNHCAIDLAFIAHAREDVPKLVAEVRRLRGALRLVDQLGASVRDALWNHVHPRGTECWCEGAKKNVGEAIRLLDEIDGGSGRG